MKFFQFLPLILNFSLVQVFAVLPDLAKSFKNDKSLSETITSKLELKKGPVRVSIHHQPSHRAGASYAMSRVTAFLQLTEDTLQYPLSPGPKGIQIFGKGSVVSNYEDINISMATIQNSPALLYHELGHLWFGLSVSTPGWFEQGVVSFLPYALYRMGRLKLNRAEAENLVNAWGLRQKAELDAPLARLHKMKTRKSARAFYDKAFKVQYLLWLELGAEKYLVFLKKIMAKKTWNTDELVSALNNSKPINWNLFLSGWVFGSEYSKLTLADFIDSDFDGLLNVEEHYAGTSKTRPDTDGDGYSDYYEISQGLDPLRVTPPGRTAIDGTREEISLRPIHSQPDARKDSTGTNDIKSLTAWSYQNKIMIRVDFFNKTNQDVYHTLFLRRPDGVNYLIQTRDSRNNALVQTFKDGQSTDQFQKYSNAGVQTRANRVFEALLDPAAFGIKGPLQIKYHVGGYNKTENWSVDTTNMKWVFLNPSAKTPQGEKKWAHVKRVLTDPASDTRADSEYFDLDQVSIIIENNNLFVESSFHNSVETNQQNYITLHFRSEKTRKNYWLQFRGSQMVAFSTFKDGTHYKEWSKQRPWPRVMLNLSRLMQAVVPLDFLETTDQVMLKIYTGGMKGDKTIFDADETDFFKIE